MPQRTIVLEYNGQKIVSQPFKFQHACLIDDEMYKSRQRNLELTDGLMNQWALVAIQKMFEGTILTDEIIEIEINHKELKANCKKVLDWYFGMDEEIKNS